MPDRWDLKVPQEGREGEQLTSTCTVQYGPTVHVESVVWHGGAGSSEGGMRELEREGQREGGRAAYLYSPVCTL